MKITWLVEMVRWIRRSIVLTKKWSSLMLSVVSIVVEMGITGYFLLYKRLEI